MMLFNKLLLLFLLILNDYCYSVPTTFYKDQIVNITGTFSKNINNKPVVKIQNKICEVFDFSVNHISCYLNILYECTNEIKINYDNNDNNNSTVINYSNLICPERAIIEKLIINYDEQRKHTSLTIAGNYFPILNPIIKFSLNNNKKKLYHESQIFDGTIPGSSQIKCKNLEINENYIICNSISNDLYSSIFKSKKSNHHYLIISPDISTIYNINETINDYLFNNTILIKQISSDNLHILNKSYKKVSYISIPSFILIILIIIMSILIHKKNKKVNKKQ